MEFSNKEILEIISGILILGSNIPYAIRIQQGKIKPSLATWILYMSTGFLVLITYHYTFYQGKEGNHNFYEQFFLVAGFLDSVIICILISKKTNKKKELFSEKEKWLIIFVFIILFFLIFIQISKQMLLVALCVGILMEILSSEPQLVKNFKTPQEDRPIPWIIYAIGYFLPVFTLEDPLKYTLPIAMSVFYLIMALPLVNYRIKNKIPLKDWI